jgi:hypothetical protein
MSVSEGKVVRPGILLFGAVILLAAVIAGGYGITHRSLANTPTSIVSQPQVTNAVVPTTTPTVTAPPATQPPVVTQAPSGVVNIRRVVVADGMRIDVLEMECGLTKVGSGYATLAAEPGSQWCLVRVNVKNISSSPGLWSAGGETAYDAQGKSFSSESDAELYVSNSNLMSGINPGVSAPDVVPFELPMNDKLVRMSFFGGFNEAAVSVPLR